MLTSRMHAPAAADAAPEDIFQSSISELFSDDTQTSHGTPGESLIYQSPKYGAITIRLPLHPDLDSGRQLFAHYLWNAAVLVTHLIEQASRRDRELIGSHVPPLHKASADVCGQKVLELGAGASLPSMIAILSAASKVCTTDHPTSPALVSGAIQVNLQESLRLSREGNSMPLSSIKAHKWGSLDDEFAEKYRHYFTRIISADCLWRTSQHRNLALSLVHFLSKDVPGACALIVAGFHTGRRVVADFFRQFALVDGDEDIAGELKVAEIYESDVDGTKRAWHPERPTEGKEEAKRWCVVAIIMRT